MRFHSFIISVLMLATFTASANLLISPVKIEFSDRDRVQEIALINSSNETRSYRLEWEEKKALPQGGFQFLTEAEKTSFLIASPLLRFSPRQVTLKPRERQTVKVMLRRQGTMQNGTYRSFLKFLALPPVRKIENSPVGGMQISFEPLMSYSLPVTVQQGPLDYQVAIDSVDFSYNVKTQKGEITLQYSRKGSSVVRANFIAYWTPKGGQESAVGRVSDLSLYPEVSRRTLTLGWVPTSFTTGAGTLRVAVEGVKQLNGKVLAEKTLTLPSVKTVSQ